MKCRAFRIPIPAVISLLAVLSAAIGSQSGLTRNQDAGSKTVAGNEYTAVITAYCRTSNARWPPESDVGFTVAGVINTSYYSAPFGSSGDIPAPGDYDGDGRFDTTVFRPSSATWYVQRTTGGTVIQQFGADGDRPVANAFVR